MFSEGRHTPSLRRGQEALHIEKGVGFAWLGKSTDGQSRVCGMVHVELLRRIRRSFALARQVAEVRRLLGKVYAVPQANRRDVREFVRANQNLLLGWATTFDLAVLYLICLLDTADRSDPLGRQKAEHWIAATDIAVREGVKISANLLRGLAQAARDAYGVDAGEVIGRAANG